MTKKKNSFSAAFYRFCRRWFGQQRFCSSFSGQQLCCQQLFVSSVCAAGFSVTAVATGDCRRQRAGFRYLYK
jgi:hypothetical protein